MAGIDRRQQIAFAGKMAEFCGSATSSVPPCLMADEFVAAPNITLLWTRWRLGAKFKFNGGLLLFSGFSGLPKQPDAGISGWHLTTPPPKKPDTSSCHPISLK